MRRFFMISLCILFFNCSNGDYGNFLFSFNEYENGIIFKGVKDDVRIRTETFYIPETMYGIPVVGIGRPEDGRKIYAKTVVLPNSVTQIGEYSFKSNIYPSLKNIIIKGVVENLDKYAFYCDSSSETSYTIVLLSTTIPPKVPNISSARSQNLEFYVPDESVTIYKQADGWSRYANSIYPLSKYKDNL